MCAHYHSVTDPTQLRRYFDVDWPPEAAKADRSACFLIPFPSDELKVANGGSVD
jgi:hypothetical protein